MSTDCLTRPPRKKTARRATAAPQPVAAAVCETDLLQEYAAWQRSEADERVNAITHAFGCLLAIVGGLMMVASVVSHGDPWRIAGCLVFVASLVAVYAASTLSHSSKNVQWKAFYRRLDQAFIYLLIVGTYTPFGLAYWRTPAGWTLMGALWSIAILGFFSKIVLEHKVHSISMWSYITLGWLPVLAVPAMLQSLSIWTGGWMLIGGLCYTFGTLFLMLDARVRHFHAVWHLLVIAGSAFHFIAIFSAVAAV
jgi:hemolysin III